jgi:hypothetical protein
MKKVLLVKKVLLAAVAALLAVSYAVAQTTSFPPGPTAQNVRVVNTPLPVTLSTAARVPFHTSAQNINANNQSQTVDVFVVPMGKRLVIESVGWQTTVDQGKIGKARLSSTVGGTFASHRLGVQDVGNMGVNGGLIVEAGQVVKFFADGGTTVRGQVFSEGIVENVIFDISGFLEDLN